MASNILALPFRRSRPVSLSSALKAYITDAYDQHPDMFKSDLAAIDKLRAEAVSIQEAHTSGIRKIAAYAAQLAWLSGKFPAELAGVEFSWTPAIGFNTQTTVHDASLRFELANVLYNLAALYSQLAIALNRSTPDGLKTASDYLCRAAGVLEHLRADVMPSLEATVPEDMDEVTLECLRGLMLAQAQECGWSLAVKNGYKDGTIARLAAQVSDYYDIAADAGTKTETVETAWLHHMSVKHHHFAAAAQLRAACDCLEKGRYGEEVTRLREAVACASEGLREAQWVGKVVVGDLNALKSKAAEDLKRAEKDNDIIYLQIPPPKSELRKLDRANVATAKLPAELSEPTKSLGDNGSLGQPLFTKLVPYSVHVAASLYAEKRDRLVNAHILDELEALNNRMRDMLKSLNLPGSLEALEKPLGLPASVKAHADEIRQQGGLHKLRRSVREVDKLKGDDAAVYQEGVSLLRAESAEDEQARTKYGTERWRRPAGPAAMPALYKRLEEIGGYLQSAGSSDDLIRDKVSACEPALKVMEGTTMDLETYVPNSRKTAMSGKVQAEATRLRTILDDLERMEGRRRRKAQAIREKAQRDDVNPALLAETARLEREFPMQRIEAAQFDGLFERRLEEAYDDDRLMVRTERDEQEALLGKLKAANSSFATARRGDAPASRDREHALQRLEQAYRQFHEVLRNLDVARKFYNDLSRIVASFRDDCKGFRHARRQEASQAEAELSNAMSALNLQAQTELKEQREREAMRSKYNTRSSASTAGVGSGVPAAVAAAAPGAPPGAPAAAAGSAHPGPPHSTTAGADVQAPQPKAAPVTAVWNPDMGIKFAPAAAPVAGGAATLSGPPLNAAGGNISASTAVPSVQGGQPDGNPLSDPQAGPVAHNPAYPSTRAGRWSPNRGLRFG